MPVRAASFQGLGDLPGGPFSSGAGGVSADGSVVVGGSSVGEGIPFVCDETDAFRWTEATGMERLGPLDDSTRWSGSAVSADGSTAVGTGGPDSVCTHWTTFRWREDSGFEVLPFFGAARAVSAQGSVVVGFARTQQGDRAVRWTPENGSFALGVLGAISGGGRSDAFDVTDDGALVVGWTSSDTRNNVPFRWTAASGMVALGDLTGRAEAVSPEGSCIAGRAAFGAQKHQAFLWSEEGGFVPLPYLTGGANDPPSMWVTDVSTGCGVVVGYADTGAFPFGSEGFVWRGGEGMQRVSDVLGAQGIDLTGWALSAATGVSADGSTIVGSGVNPDGAREAWIARVPEPPGSAAGAAALAALGGLGAGRSRLRSRDRRS
jgi:probable HAF family extracellular repeat protein